MSQPFGLLDPLTGGLFYDLSVLLMLFLLVAVPTVTVLAIRFLWYRHICIGRSAELEKLVWQLHRVASALETRAAISATDGEPTAPESRPVSMSMFGRQRP